MALEKECVTVTVPDGMESLGPALLCFAKLPLPKTTGITYYPPSLHPFKLSLPSTTYTTFAINLSASQAVPTVYCTFAQLNPTLPAMSTTAILVPLYVYPFEGAWQPLFDAITAHPDTQFLVVINPGNGPGPAALPDANYCREIPKLRSHSNVTVFGYVHVQWAQRQFDAVLQDVETYAAWPDQPNYPHEPVQIDGIFIDETPTAADARTLEYLGCLASMIHRIWPSHDTSGDTPAAWTPVHGIGTMPTVRYTLSHPQSCLILPARLLSLRCRIV